MKRPLSNLYYILMKLDGRLLKVLFVSALAFLFTYLVVDYLGSEKVSAETSWEKISTEGFSNSGVIVTHSLSTDSGVYFALSSPDGVKVWFWEEEGGFQNITSFSGDISNQVYSLIEWEGEVYISTET